LLRSILFKAERVVTGFIFGKRASAKIITPDVGLDHILILSTMGECKTCVLGALGVTLNARRNKAHERRTITLKPKAAHVTPIISHRATDLMSAGSGGGRHTFAVTLRDDQVLLSIGEASTATGCRD
jgi:hypothetical protein